MAIHVDISCSRFSPSKASFMRSELTKTSDCSMPAFSPCKSSFLSIDDIFGNPRYFQVKKGMRIKSPGEKNGRAGGLISFDPICACPELNGMRVIRGLILPSESWLNKLAMGKQGFYPVPPGFYPFPETTVTRDNLPEAGQAPKLMGWRLSCDYKRLATAGAIGNRLTRGLVAFPSNRLGSEGRGRGV